MHNARTHWLCLRARASLAKAATVLAAWVLVASTAYGQSASVTKVEAFSPHTAGVYCQGTTCWVTRGKSVLVRAFGTGITQATQVTDGSTNLSSSLTGMKQVGTPGWVEVQLAPTTSAARGNVNVTVQQKIGSNVVGSWTFSVYVIGNGSISNTSVPAPAGCFTQADVTITGANLGSSRGVFNWTLPTPPTSVTRTGTADGETRFRLSWNTPQSATSIQGRLCDEALPSSLNCAKGVVPIYGEFTRQVNSPVTSCGTTGGSTPPPALQGNLVQNTLYRLGSATTVDNASNNYVPLNPFLNSPFCQGIAQPNPPYDANNAQRSTRQTITVPAIQWSVRNNGGSMTGSVTARLMRGGQAVQTQTITGLASGQSSSTFTYSRPSNTTCVARLGADGGCYHCGTSSEGWNDNNISINFQ